MMRNARRRVPGVVIAATLLALSGLGAGADDEAERRRVEERLRELETKAAAERGELAAEVVKWENLLDRLKRRLPPQFDAAEERKALQKIAEVTRLEGLDVRVLPGAERVPLADGSPSPFEVHRMEVSARDEFGHILWFLQRASLGPRAVSVEQLRLVAGDDGKVSLSARLALPVDTGGESQSPPSPRAAQGAGAGAKTPLDAYYTARAAMVARMVEDVRRARDRARGLVEAALKLARPEPAGGAANAIGAFAREAGEEAIALSEVRADGSGAVTLAGVLQGEAARAALKPALERARFAGPTVELSPDGECTSFSITARLEQNADPEKEPELETGEHNGLFAGRAAAACRPEPEPVLGRAAAGPPGPAESTLLRLRDADAADVFRVIHHLTHEGFVLDADVAGRVSVDASGRASVAEILGSLESAGLVVGPGPLHRVSRAPAKPPAPRPTTYEGQPVSFEFAGADLRDVLRVFQEISGAPTRIAPEVEGRVTVFARETPWDQILDAIAASAGLEWSVENDGLSIKPAAAGKMSAGLRAAEPQARPRWRTFTTLESLGPDDLTLAGRSVVGGDWTAYAYGPGRHLWELTTGTRLFRAQVKSVGPRGVEFASETRGALVRTFPD